MKLTITGRLYAEPGGVRSLTWDEGELSGDTETVAAIRAEAARLDGRHLGPIPGGETTTTTGHLSEPYSFLHLVTYVLSDIAVEGMPPYDPDAPANWLPGFVNAREEHDLPADSINDRSWGSGDKEARE